MDWLFSVLTVLFIMISVALALVILLQRPQGGGLAQAFGGSSGGSTDTAFGGRTGDALTVATVAVFAIYILTAIALNIIDNPADAKDPLPEEAVLEPGLIPTVDGGAAPVAVPTVDGGAAPADVPTIEGGAVPAPPAALPTDPAAPSNP